MDEKNGGPNQVAAWRKHRGLTQEALAEKLDCTKGQVAMLETGERALTARWLRQLAAVLDTSPGNLLDHPPSEGTAQILDLWDHADVEQRRTMLRVSEAVVGREREAG